MARTYGLTHIHLIVSDLERSQRFYHGVVGAEERFRVGDDLVFLRTPGTKDLIALHGNSPDAGAAGASAGVSHFGFQLIPPANLDEAVRVVETLGGHVKERGAHRDPAHHDVSYAHVTDPDGYVIELLAADPVRGGRSGDDRFE